MRSLKLSLTIVCLAVSVLNFYDVPSYYGHFSRDFFKLSKIQAGNFTYFEYHFSVDVDPTNNTIYIANK